MNKLSNNISFALVGCGRIAKRHSELLGNNIINNAKHNLRFLPINDFHITMV